jgi:hypothetical protein
VANNTKQPQGSEKTSKKIHSLRRFQRFLGIFLNNLLTWLENHLFGSVFGGPIGITQGKSFDLT